MKALRRSRPALAVATLVGVVSMAVAAVAAEAPTFNGEQLEQIVAPIALYPDSLLAQVFMASTYPLEVVEAARFAKENPDLKEEALEKALQDKSWDDSVKSLVAFPQVLAMMNEKLDWTQKLGDAFLAQQKEVMDAVQRLRAKAKEAGNLETTKEQKVVVEQAPAAPPNQVVVQQAPPTIITIEPANPQVVYVPTYNPAVVYGPWPYPAYPPYYYYPPGYVATASLFSFGLGMAVGAAFWGGSNCNWHNGNIDIDVNHNYNSNRNVNRNTNRDVNRTRDTKWQHDPSHRKGVDYRDKGTQQRFGRETGAGASSREAFRGRAEQGRQDLSRPGGTEKAQRDLARGGGAGGAQAGTRDLGRGGAGGAQAGSRDLGKGGAGAGTRDLGGAGSPGQRSGQARAASGGRTPSSLEGIGNGSSVRRDSSRGNASRQSASSWGGSRGGRGGGGGSRGGGGGGRRP